MIKFLKNFLKKIEDQNNESFGTGKLDCCDLNKKNTENTKKNEENNSK